ncbi:hypothetical protein K431DRAFT_167920 [Polychaeton citri CBS 116435]|uniref:Uncharacterized protein n=1 Tax=Polychaeton citri CBS 116435 TaxID=1314669 RepID=A0A9P4UIM0_9PEZI|nr:hypothetical protein K431DRAFT_167920 [Polychaeton citri CBS 116435]
MLCPLHLCPSHIPSALITAVFWFTSISLDTLSIRYTFHILPVPSILSLREEQGGMEDRRTQSGLVFEHPQVVCSPGRV